MIPLLALVATQFMLGLAAEARHQQPSVKVYRLDGSLQCRPGSGQSLDEMGHAFERLGVRIISRDKKPVPFLLVVTACNTPTGVANIYEIPSADLPKARSSGFLPWPFDSKATEVYKYNGSLQCEAGSGVPVLEMETELTAAGVTVLSAQQLHDGRVRPAMCGLSTGTINVYAINTSDLERAIEQKFIVRLSESELKTFQIFRRPGQPEVQTVHVFPQEAYKAELTRIFVENPMFWHLMSWW